VVDSDIPFLLIRFGYSSPLASGFFVGCFQTIFSYSISEVIKPNLTTSGYVRVIQVFYLIGVTMGKCNSIGDVGGTKTAIGVVYVDCGLACLID
jgi:hypothetical protein